MLSNTSSIALIRTIKCVSASRAGDRMQCLQESTFWEAATNLDSWFNGEICDLLTKGTFTANYNAVLADGGDGGGGGGGGDIIEYSEAKMAISQKSECGSFSCRRFINSLLCVPLTAGDKVTRFPVVDIDQNDIVDTNGAGDAFVGGEVLQHTPQLTTDGALPCVIVSVFNSH